MPGEGKVLGYSKDARRWIRRSEKASRKATRKKFIARFFRVVSGMQLKWPKTNPKPNTK
jgi:hypothetical protein